MRNRMHASPFQRGWPIRCYVGAPKKQNPQLLRDGGFRECSLTMTYFHTGIRTIIGAESFHCPVRDGKEWFQLAMVIRLKLVSTLPTRQHTQFIESQSAFHRLRKTCITFFAVAHSITSLKVIGSSRTSN